MTSTLCFEPDSVLLSQVPLFGERVFRLSYGGPDYPVLSIRGTASAWTEYCMVREGENNFYTALRLQPGEYWYRFTIRGMPVMDRDNLQPLICSSGRLANTTEVPSLAKEVLLRNVARDKVEFVLKVYPDWVTVTPSRLVLRQHEEAVVTIGPFIDQLVPGLLSCRVTAERETDCFPLGTCHVTIDALDPSVPSLSWSVKPQRNGSVSIRFTFAGKGQIHCRVLDRLVPRMHEVVLSCPTDFGVCSYEYPTKPISGKKLAWFREIPPLVIMTDSPFPDQRIMYCQAIDLMAAQ